MTNEPPESPALVMDGLAAGRRGGRGLGRGAPIKINVSFSWSRARHRGRNWRGVYERPGQRGAGRQKLGGRGWGRREVQRQRPETRVPRDDGVGTAAGEKETRRDWEQEREMETRRDCPEKERQRQKSRARDT